MKIGLFADVDLNLVDGSSLWVESVAEAIQVYTPHTPVVLSRKELKDAGLLYQSLRRKGLLVLQPSDLGANPTGGVAGVLDSPGLRDIGLDVLLVRGLSAVLAAGARCLHCGQLWGYVTEFDANAYKSEGLIRDLRAAVQNVDWFLVQTEPARDFVAGLPGVPAAKLAVISPMIPKRYLRGRGDEFRRRSIVYAGKFAPDWGLLELHALAHEFSRAGEPMPIKVYGSRIHDPSEGRQFSKDLASVQSDPIIEWRGTISRDDVVRELRIADYCWAWRSRMLEDRTLELSSKVLEACAAGCLPICYPSAANLELLGEEYPLFARSADEAYASVRALERDPVALAELRSMIVNAVSNYIDSVVVRGLFRALLPPKLIASFSIGAGSRRERSKLLVAGHDLKFTEGIVRNLRLQFDVAEERWSGHDDREIRSSTVDQDVDCIWCEWCLGNAVHYSLRRLPHQTVVIRFHLQEFDTPYPEQVTIENVHKVIFVNEYHRQVAIGRFGWPVDKTAVVPNYVEPSAYLAQKSDDAYFNIAMIGIVPARKRLDRALDLIEHLRRTDERWTLWLKGKRPDDYPWIHNRPEELDYYQEIWSRLERTPALQAGVRLVDSGADVPQFLQNMGWVLSPSDFESFHLAIAEGACAGAVPIIWGWDAATSIYDEFIMVSSVEDAALRIMSTSFEEWRCKSDSSRLVASAQFAVQEISSRFFTVAVGLAPPHTALHEPT